MELLPSIQIDEITHTQLVRYAGASGDFNPIHTVESVGKKVGLDGVIAHGMLIMGYASKAVGKWYPNKRIRDVNVRFVSMTKPGESLVIEGKVIEKIESDGNSVIKGEIIVRNEADVKLKGTFNVLED